MPLSLIEVQPHTGFTHQIRVHMAEILNGKLQRASKRMARVADVSFVAAPILGDRKYTPTDHYTKSDLASRHLVPTPDDTTYLHAAELTFFVCPKTHYITPR